MFLKVKPNTPLSIGKKHFDAYKKMIEIFKKKVNEEFSISVNISQISIVHYTILFMHDMNFSLHIRLRYLLFC